MFLQHKVDRKRVERSDTKNMGSADLDVVNARVGRAIGVRDVDAQQPAVRNRYLFLANLKEKWAGLRVTDERERETDEKCVREMGKGRRRCK